MSEVSPGWYPDPAPEDPNAPTERYWDGFSWSHQVRPSQSGVTVVVEGPYPDRSYNAPTIPSTPDGQVLAGWWQRAGATIADWVIMIPLFMLVAAPSLANHWHSITTWWQAGYGSGDTLVTDGSTPNPPVLDPSTQPGLILYASLVAAGLVYTLVFLRWKQATPGKLLTGLKIRRREIPGPLPWSTILRRAGFTTALTLGVQVPAVGIGFLIISLLDYLWPLWDTNRQALHDKVAGTNVVLSKIEPTVHPGPPPPADSGFKPVAGSNWARATDE